MRNDRFATFLAGMTSLAHLARKHDSVLVIDCASNVIQVGIIWAGGATHWAQQEGEAGTALFTLVEGALTRAGLRLEHIGAYAFNQGPGSILGIRTSAVALRSWTAVYPKPCYAFNGLVAFALAQRGLVALPFTAIADARRETWHAVSVQTDGVATACRRVTGTDLPGSCLHPDGFRAWSKRPEGTRDCAYDLANIFTSLRTEPLFVDAPSPDAFLHEEPTYQTWTPQVHRAPSR